MAMKKENNRISPKLMVAFTIGILILLAAIGILVLYTFIQPPIRTSTEVLPLVNSSGEYCVLTNYENARDTTYANVIRFISSVNIDDRHHEIVPFELNSVNRAVTLHDDAEKYGINCSVLGMDLLNNRPLRTLVVFNTTDRGPIYVDITSGNLSYLYRAYGDGINKTPAWVPPENTILRDRWSEYIGWDFSRKDLYVTEYRNAKPVSYDDLVKFLNEDDTNRTRYTPNYTCKDFAAQLFNNAEAHGIKCGVVSLHFINKSDGHAINVFPTTDKGDVFIDSTGSEYGAAVKSIVYIGGYGEPVGSIPLVYAKGTDYQYYNSSGALKTFNILGDLDVGGCSIHW
jgi:hypothetical protein